MATEDDTGTEHDEDHQDDLGEGEDGEGGEKFTQKQVDAMIRRRLRNSKKTLRKELLEEFGVEDPDALKDLLAKGSEPESGSDSSKDGDGESKPVDEAKLRERIEKQVRREAAEREAKRDLDERVKDAIVDRYGVTAKAARKLAKMVDDLETSADDEDIEDALEELEEAMPTLFRGEDNDEQEGQEGEAQRRRPNDGRRGRQSNPGGQPRRPRGKGGSPATAARTLLHERHPQLRDKQT